MKAVTAFEVFGSDWKQLALHTAACAVTADNGVACCGFGNTQATRIEGFGNDVLQVSVSLDTVCALKQSGGVMCGRIGGAAPVSVKGVEGATLVSTGGALESDSAAFGRMVATTKDGAAYWALGGKTAQRMTQAGNDVLEIYIGETTASEHMFAAGTRGGSILSWGTNRCGALGDGLGGGGDTSHDHRVAVPACQTSWGKAIRAAAFPTSDQHCFARGASVTAATSRQQR